MTLEDDDELGEVAVSDDPAELLLGDEHARDGPALAHLVALPALHVALRVSDDLDHLKSPGRTPAAELSAVAAIKRQRDPAI